MSEDMDKALTDIPKELLDEIVEYERKERVRRAGSRERRGRFPSNEDIVDAIKDVSGGAITRYNIDTLYEATKQYLEERGFDTSVLSESRFWRLVTNLTRKGHLRTDLR
jgi:hypothetical protein